MLKIMFNLLACCSLSLFCMELTIKNLSLDKKIGQLFMVAAVADETIEQESKQKKSYRMDKNYITDLIKNHGIGGIIYLGKSDKEKQIARTHYFQSISPIPLLIGQDLEPGRVGAARFPGIFTFASNKILGDTHDTEVTKIVGTLIGEMCKELGVHINFAPVVDVDSNPHNPVINDRAFSNKPQIVTAHGIAFTQGLHEYNILACAKHFPGLGDTSIDPHHALPVINHPKQRLHGIELYPFKKLIEKKVPAVMVGHVCVPAFEAEKNLPATFSKAIVTDLLQKELGFSGLIITDALDMAAITKTYKPGETAVKALCAGNDILLCPVDVPAAIAAIKNAIKDGVLTEQDIDKHVEKILKIKKIFFDF